MKTPSFIKRLGRCQCDKLSTEHPLHHVPKPGFIERLLMRLVPHFDIIKTVNNCDLCEDSGFTRGATSSSLGPYDRICDDCAGQSTQVDQATLLYLRRFYVFRAKWFGKWAAKHLGDIYLHHIVRNDDDESPHDHPWGFTGIVLAGGYADECWEWTPGGLEYVQQMSIMHTLPKPTLIAGPARFESVSAKRTMRGIEMVRPGMIIRRSALHTHRVLVSRAKGSAWTLIFTNRTLREWGFLTEKGWVHWKKFLGVE